MFMETSTRRTLLVSLFSAVWGAGFSSVAIADEGCCAHCGCVAKRCRQICRLVSENKKITTTCWGMKCEDFCVPGPSTPDCQHSETICSPGPDSGNVCSAPKKRVWTTWIPSSSGEIFTKRKLMKKTVTTTVPAYKWVVESACPQCIAAFEPVCIPPRTKIPPMPLVATVHGLELVCTQKLESETSLE